MYTVVGNLEPCCALGWCEMTIGENVNLVNLILIVVTALIPKQTLFYMIPHTAFCEIA
jgi:hypothetical protein